MALVRCEGHGNPQGRTADYVIGLEPVGYPETAAVCGLKDCVSPGLVWLTEVEYNAYRNGEHIFQLATYAVKVRVK